MMKTTKLFLLALLLLTATLHVAGMADPGARYAVIIGGPGGLENFTAKYLEQTQRLYELLTNRFHYDPKNITYLFGDAAGDSAAIDGAADADNVRASMARLAQVMTEQDGLLLFMIGHGSFDGTWAKFNLLGPDLTDLEYARMLARLKAKNIVIINMSSASGPFISKLSGSNRIVITATKSGRQYHETTFADFFLDALSSEAADADKDARVNVAEAFAFARAKQDEWYAEKRRLRAEHPLLDDNGDGHGSQFIADNAKDGRLARTVFWAAETARLPQADAADKDAPEYELVQQKLRLQQAIETLKRQKDTLSETAYAKKLEAYLIELAKTSRKIKELESVKNRK